MTEKNEIKFPLTKKLRAEYVEKYEKIFFKQPPHNIGDEKLVELINSNLEKLNATNANTQSKSQQEGTQDEEIENDSEQAIKAGGERSEADESGNLKIDVEGINKIPEGGLIIESKNSEREFAINEYQRLYGEPAAENLSTEEISAFNLTKEKLNEGTKVYFDLFGKNPLPEMSVEQIYSAITSEKERQATLKAASDGKDSTESSDEFDYDSETQMVVVSIKNPTEKKIINKKTFEFLKHEYKEVYPEPKEVKQLKNK